MVERDGWWVFGTVLAWIIAIVLVLSGLGKVFGAEMFVESFSRWNLLPFILLIGVVEIFISVLFLIRETSVIGGYLITGYLGGAVAIHLAFDGFAFALFPFLFLLVVWVVMFMRKPGCFSWD